MKFDLKKEYQGADLTNRETLKQIIINKFKEYNLPIDKIRKSRLNDGLYIYGKYCEKQGRIVRKLVKKISEYEYLYERSKKYYNCSFIGTDNLEEFENILAMIIHENTIRKGDKYGKEIRR